MHLKTCLVVLVLGASSTALAQHPLAYQGRLERAGQPLTGKFDFQFELYGARTGGTCAAPVTAPCLWVEKLQGVDVKDGRFSVTLGAKTGIPDAAWDQGQVFLGIQVATAGSPTFTPLAGRQEMLPVHRVAKADTAKNYTVTEDLTVGGKAQVAGTLTTGKVNLDPCLWSQNPPDEAGFCNDRTVTKALQVVGNRSAGTSSGPRRVVVLDEMEVSNRLDVPGGLDLGLQITTCSATDTDCLCPKDLFPLNYTVNCDFQIANSGGSDYRNGVWAARWYSTTVNNELRYGVKAMCTAMWGPQNSAKAKELQLLCGRVKPLATPPSSQSPWDFGN